MGALPLGLVVTLLGIAWKPYLAPGAYGLPVTAAMALVTIGGLPMCLGYLAWIVHWRARLAWLAPVGRMALTHYLGQSLLCTWTFYHYGLGRFEMMPRSCSCCSRCCCLPRRWSSRTCGCAISASAQSSGYGVR